ncbi:5-formyltetrahydrofolate cyclo-ligase [Bacillus subtilis]|uniref:5-formyltetrahydrofolate cyclo-ligase n=1 Tax=Bacillus subtilis TaxID=1423 RepID=UPI00059E566D|nr:5-formyltetrahydrofolate cyclo-ligase [Bacillus subtilis]KIN40500.1 5-formyltetrahydrofolate cyclo-ligase [Bacillus subtilis]MBO3765146.1 5-formyltetrahydrofolate cyclo-ligase [Bacillus subtilis]MCB4340623.1 5-formyltetrahydrofolate cyclo-ligase [Bacillus subtilis]MDP8526227.1 5-formyltetrahydrofolate cyclo-ligase [Bacillus subtilis]ODV48633.1 5-formyltetrahydrofolate cyclo-ligase [Bacillus subtilis]
MKSQLRKKTLEALSALSNEDILQKTERMYKYLFSLPEWQNAGTIAVTISRGLEIPTHPVIEQAWEEGKQVCIPKCHPDTQKMQFRTYQTDDQLETVYAGLLEPVIEKTKVVNPSQIDLMIVPGVCFDVNGFRVGFGGGYYDRYLSEYEGKTVSLLLECQLFAHVPRLPHDIPVHKLITEDRIISCFS